MALAVGSIARHGFFIAKNKAELPDDMALEVKVFLFWLVILTSQRQMLTAVVVGSTAGGR